MKLLQLIDKLDLTKVDDQTFETLSNRRQLFTSLGKFGAKAAAVAAPAIMMALPKAIYAQTATTVNVLNFALTLEYLEAEFYSNGNANSGFITQNDRQIISKIGADETAHVNFLKAALGANAVAKPTFDFTAGGLFADVFTNYATFLAVAQAFEDTGVRAYKGAAPLLQSDVDDFLQAALNIHSVEARHAAVIRTLRGTASYVQGETGAANGGLPAATDGVYQGENNVTQGGTSNFTDRSAAKVGEAFDEPLTMDQVLVIVDPFIV